MSHPFRLLYAALILAAAPLGLRAAEPPKPPPSLEEKTSESLKKLQGFVDAAENATRANNPAEAKNQWQQSIDLLESMIPQTKPDSYDRFLVEDTLGKIYWQGKNDPATAVTHFLNVREMLRTHPEYMQPKDQLEHIKWLAQAYYQKALAIKKDPVQLRETYDQSMKYMKEYIDKGQHPTQEDYMLYAMLLYSKATVVQNHIDKAVLEEAEKATRQALTLVSHPKPDLYQLLVAELEGKGDLLNSADYLEVLVRLKPTDKDYWAQLFGVYNNLAEGAEKDKTLQRQYFARAINTLERAQKLGFMKTPRDNYNLVSLYNEAGQLATCVQLLDKGLHNGTIENKSENWVYLALFYLQIDKPNEAINTLKEAVKHFPKNGDLYFQLAQYYGQVYNTEQTYVWAKRALEHKPFKTTKEWQVYFTLAYAAYELQKYEDALDAVQHAKLLPKADTKSLIPFEKAIQEAIKQRDAVKKANSVTTNP